MHGHKAVADLERCCLDALPGVSWCSATRNACMRPHSSQGRPMQRLRVARAQGPGQSGLIWNNPDGWFSLQSSLPGGLRFYQACFVGKYDSVHGYHKWLVSFLTPKYKGGKSPPSSVITTLFIPCYPLQMNQLNSTFQWSAGCLRRTPHWHVISGVTQVTSALLLLLPWLPPLIFWIPYLAWA